ncbi:DUF7948 domain-containing protein [Taibaiella koreensis]|uniref:DUF7948 domain-containing protein n=1 Tax=Taibaiella koreensis TaxID=1268548 RepID=UPI0013C37216|nr:T9SS type A sorting domain-containing protein [Taibaiella koreensis]
MKTSTTILMFLLLLLHYGAQGKDGEQPNKLTYFKENKGQLIDQNGAARGDIFYYGASDGLQYYFKKSGISYQLYQRDEEKNIHLSRVDVSWLGANTQAELIGQNKAGAVENFIRDGRSIFGARQYNDLLYRNLYKDIDLHYYYQGASLKYDFIVAPHADYRHIRLEMEGASALRLNKDGTLTIVTANGSVTEGVPVAYQNKKPVPVSWIMKDNVLGFQVGNYDPSQPLIIDPLIYRWYSSTLTSGSSLTQSDGTAYASVHDNNNNVYVISSAADKNGPMYDYYARITSRNSSTGAVNWTRNVADFFTGSNITPSNAFPAEGLALGINCLYLCGSTGCTAVNIATSGAYQTTIVGQQDCFLAKYALNGDRIWVTYYGGAGDDSAKRCIADAYGNMYICGTTSSTGSMATINAFQPALAGSSDAFIAKFDSAGRRVWSTYYGGSATDMARSIAIQGSQLFVAGTTTSAGIATVGSHQQAFAGNQDGFLLCLDTTGSTRQWSTYYGADSTTAENCVVGGNAIYLSGTTNSASSIATPGVYQGNIAGGRDAYLAKFDMSGVRQWGTYHGGTGDETGSGTVMGSSGNLYLCGTTTSDTAIATFMSYQTNYSPIGSASTYLSEFNSNGQKLSGTYFNGAESAVYCSANNSGDVFISGGYYIAYPLHPPVVLGYLAKFSYCNDTTPVIDAPETHICSGTPVTISVPAVPSTTYQWYRNDTLITGATQNIYTASLAGLYRILVNGCPPSSMAAVSLTQSVTPLVQVTHTDIPCYASNSGTINVAATNGTPPYTYQWNNLPDTTAFVSGLDTGTYIVHTRDVYSCGKIDTVKITKRTTTPPSNPLASLCVVTTDSATEKNLVVWEKVGDVRAVSYNVYRETSVMAQYELIGTRSVDSLSTFLDIIANPLQQSYTYALAEVDSCGNEWPLSERHTTIHLSANMGVNGEINLSWNTYAGRSYSTHYIERSFNGGPFTLLNEVSSTMTAYSDLTPPLGDKVYRIAIDVAPSCAPSKPTDIARVTSNTVSFITSGIGEHEVAGFVELGPNPTTGLLMIHNFKPAVIKVYDFAGRQVLSEKNTTSINLGGLSKGTYLVRLLDKNANVQYSKKVILK